MDEGVQLPLLIDLPSNEMIVFEGTYCLDDCPFNEVYKARGRDCTIYVQAFASQQVLEPTKWLITIQQDYPKYKEATLYHYIELDIWAAYRRIEELTGRSPVWRLFVDQENIPTPFGKC